MARTGELIGAIVGAVPGTAMARNMANGATAARTDVLNGLHEIFTSA